MAKKKVGMARKQPAAGTHILALGFVCDSLSAKKPPSTEDRQPPTEITYVALSCQAGRRGLKVEGPCRVSGLRVLGFET